MTRTKLQVVIDSTVQLAALYAAYVIFGFGLDKVLGQNGAIAGMRQVANAVGVDPTLFRYFVGTQELLVGTALFTAVALFIPRVPSLVQRVNRAVFTLGALGLIATMAGGIATELFVRPGQQDWLLYLGIRLAVIGGFALTWGLARFGLPFKPRAIIASSSTAPRGLVA